MAFLINAASFVKSGVQDLGFSSGPFDVGTVEVTLRGETQRVEARSFSDGSMVAFGLVGRYQTGAKAWPASIYYRMSGDGTWREHVNFGRDDRCGKFKKENAIWFEKTE